MHKSLVKTHTNRKTKYWMQSIKFQILMLFLLRSMHCDQEQLLKNVLPGKSQGVYRFWHNFIKNLSTAELQTTLCDVLLSYCNNGWRGWGKRWGGGSGGGGENSPVTFSPLDFQKSPSSDFIWRGTTSCDFVARGRPLHGQKRLAPLAKRSTCSKSISSFVFAFLVNLFPSTEAI